MNTAARKLYGVGANDGIRQVWFQSIPFFHGDGHTRLNAADRPLARALRDEVVSEEPLWIKPDGLAPSSVPANADQIQDAAGLPWGRWRSFMT